MFTIQIIFCWLATLLECANTQICKVNHKFLLFFYLLVFFCCDVGVNGLVGKASNGPLSEYHNIYALISENVVLYSAGNTNSTSVARQYHYFQYKYTKFLLF